MNYPSQCTRRLPFARPLIGSALRGPQRRKMAPQRARLDLKEREGILEARQLVLPEAPEAQSVARGVHRRDGERGREDLATVTGRADARRGVHRKTHVTGVAERGPTGVDADAHAHPLVARPAPRQETALYLDGRGERGRGIVERGEELVSACVDLVAAGTADAVADDRA